LENVGRMIKKKYI